jgi:septal ring factor EnvC (AmiA/AmiB activator)
MAFFFILDGEENLPGDYMSLKIIPYRLILAIAVAVFLAVPWPVQGQEVQPEKPESEIASPQALPQRFEQGIARLQENLKVWEANLATATENLSQTRKEMENLQIAVASLKASMILQKLSDPGSEFLSVYADKKGPKDRLRAWSEIEVLKKDQQDQLKMP